MFYKMIENKRNQWLSSSDCTITALIDYIVKTGQMRDAQIEAIKTYLFLKIACEGKALATLFKNGAFNTLDLNALELSQNTRDYLISHPSAAALFEYACMKNDKDEQVSVKLEKAIKKTPDNIDYNKVWNDTFYGVTYTDYLFSLPMGAGKTYLMAAFIYLDLYFAMNEPQNPAFAHNFIIFAPSGLKSSVVPSLKTIQNFDPSWIIPEPAATDIKRIISFEVLDQSKTEKKSNKTKNPNVQKIANHQPLSELFGLVAVTNAEKVILGFMLNYSIAPVIYRENRYDASAGFMSMLSNWLIENNKIPMTNVYYDMFLPTKTMLTKNKSWEYEQEWRLFKLAAPSECTSHKLLSNMKPSAVYLGARIKEHNKRRLLKICKEKGIPCYQMLPQYFTSTYESEPYPLL